MNTNSQSATFNIKEMITARVEKFELQRNKGNRDEGKKMAVELKEDIPEFLKEDLTAPCMGFALTYSA